MPDITNQCDFQLVAANIISQIGNKITMEIIIDRHVHDIQIQVQLLDDSGTVLVDYYTVDTITGSSQTINFDLPSDLNVCKIKTRLYQIVCFGDGSGSDSGACCVNECEDCASKCVDNIANPTWNLDGCVPITISASKLHYDNTDGKIPDDCDPTGSVTIYVPKELTMVVNAGCFGDVTTQFQYLPTSSLWGRVWEPTPPWENDYNTNPNTDNLSFNGPNGTLDITVYELLENNDWTIEETPGVFIDGFLKISVRYREAYDDYTFVKAFGTTFTKQLCTGCVCSGVPGNTPSLTETQPYNSDLYDSYYIGSFDNQGDCASGDTMADLINHITVTVTGDNTCRQPQACPTSGQCPIEVDIDDMTQYGDCLCDKCYCDGGGRPIDIDIKCGEAATAHPQESDFDPATESYTLWFAPRGDAALPVIENIVYDTGLLPTDNSVLVKVHTTATPAEMREWVCNKLRFVTLKDRSKLSTDINNAVDSNWPFNDLYWDFKCDTYESIHPNDVPINLVPC